MHSIVSHGHRGHKAHEASCCIKTSNDPRIAGIFLTKDITTKQTDGRHYHNEAVVDRRSLFLSTCCQHGTRANLCRPRSTSFQRIARPDVCLPSPWDRPALVQSSGVLCPCCSTETWSRTGGTYPRRAKQSVKYHPSNWHAADIG
jgi:hypothetical protein